MELTSAPSRRRDILGKAARTKRIFAEERRRLLDKINRIAENIWDSPGETSSPPAAGDERDSA